MKYYTSPTEIETLIFTTVTQRPSNLRTTVPAPSQLIIYHTLQNSCKRHEEMDAWYCDPPETNFRVFRDHEWGLDGTSEVTVALTRNLDFDISPTVRDLRRLLFLT